MVSDDERRRIAERLRGLRRGANNVTQLNHGPTWSLAWCVLGDGLDECGTGDWFERMCDRLADLIDPGDTSQGCRDTVACDREALLSLAEKARKLGDEEGGPASYAVRCTFRVFARDIYKALGEVVA